MELEEFTKAEIIEWIRNNFYKQPQKSDLLACRYRIQYAVVQKRDAENMAAFRAIDGKKHDDYARQCNATTDTGKKLAMLKKMKKINKQFAAHFTESDKINAEYNKVQDIYSQIGDEREKEREA